MIRPYFGEFLVSPVPIHFGLNYCSHGCHYCFANLNNPTRRADYPATKNFIDAVINGKAQKNLSVQYAKLGYPVLASNDSDPFAKSNEHQFASVFDALTDAGVALTFQTRGGERAIETLERSRKTMVYVSLTTDDEALLKRNEPGAPSHASRMDLIRAAKAMGHHVVVGLNPFVAEWWIDRASVIAQLHDAGVRHAWIGGIHLNYMQIRNMSPKFVAGNKKIIEIAQARKPQVDVDIIKAELAEAGINPFYITDSHFGGFWDDYFALGFPRFPTLDDLFTRLRKMDSTPVICFDEVLKYMTVPGVNDCSETKGYLQPIGRSIRNAGLSANAKNMREVLGFLWNISKYPSRLRHPYFCLASDGDGVAVDDNDRTMLVFTEDQSVDRVPFDDCTPFFNETHGVNHG